MGGWIKLHRQITESDIYSMPPLYLRVFERLLIEANHRDCEIPFKYPGEKVVAKKLICRGERLTSIRQICEWVGWFEWGVFKVPSPKTVKVILSWLEENQMIEIYPRKSNREGTHYKVLNYSTYQAPDEEKVTIRKQSGNNEETVTTSKQECTRMNKKKDHSPKHFSDDALEMKICKYLKDKILGSYPGAKIPSNFNKWCLSIDRLMRIDGRAPKQVKEVIDWIYQDEFWCANIRSPEKLREKWDTIWLQMNRKQKAQEVTIPPEHRRFGSDL